MEYRIGGEKVRIFPQYLEKVDLGKEGIVYKYKGNCLKLYHDKPLKDVLSLRDCEYMSKLTTERVLLPRATVCDKKHTIKGYITSPYINVKNNIYDMFGRDFLEEREAVIEELFYLADNFISVDDFWLDNFIYGDKFYFLDPGSYIVHWNMLYMNDHNNSVVLSNYNLECFDSFLIVNIFLKYIKEMVKSDILYCDIFNEIHRKYLGSLCYNKMDYISKFIIPEATLDESIKELVKSHKV